MSVSMPATKQPRTPRQTSPLTRSETVDLTNADVGEEKSRRTAVPPTSSSAPLTDQTMMKHPKGHKVRDLADVWNTMASQDFLRLTDTLALSDVWVQPEHVDPAKGGFAIVVFNEIVVAPHIKRHPDTCKISLDDLTKMLYLNDCLQADMQNIERATYEEWLNEKSALCVKAKGLEEGSNRAKLCQFILSEDKSFTFFPTYLHQRFGVFFRKICYHSYKCEKDFDYLSDGKIKFVNPSMIKCSATKGNFEYILEARILPLPDGWFDPIEVPESQII